MTQPPDPVRLAQAPMTIRPATASDASSVSALHAESWRRHYRGSYSDAYLDEAVLADREAEWRRRFSLPAGAWFTLLAMDGDDLLGFSHVWVEGEKDWGALLDNLHVVHDRQRSGLGRTLMAATAQQLVSSWPGTGIYLWVLERNTQAQAFYRALGGVFEDRRPVNPPMGRPENLVGEQWALRVVWPDPSVLIGSVGTN